MVDTVAEPEVTIRPSTLPPPRPVPPLARVEPVTVTLDFDGQAIDEVVPGVVAGAREIEVLGDADDNLSGAIRGGGITKKLVLSDGQCDSLRRFDIERGDTIEITVDKAANDTTGTYGFRIVEVVFDR